MDPRILFFYKTWYRVPFLIPAWDWDETKLALLPWRLSPFFGEDPRSELKEELDRRFGFRHVVLTSTGQLALEVGLRTLEKPGEVVIPSLICGSVARAVILAGCTPVAADVTDDLTLSADSVEERITDRTVAVVVAHLSGKPARDLDRLISLCDRRGITLIDDAAQALGVSSGGRFLGSSGRFGILSFGIGKPTFSIGGGALIANSAEEAARCEAVLRQLDLKQRPASINRLRTLRFVLEYCWRPYTLPFFLGLRLLSRKQSQVGKHPGRGGIDFLAAALQVIQMRKLDGILHSFRANADFIIDGLSGLSAIGFPQAGDSSGYTKLILSWDGEIRRFAAEMLRRRVEVEWWYRPIDLRPEFAAFRRQPNVHAESLWPRMIVLPNHPGLSLEDRQYIVDAVIAARERL